MDAKEIRTHILEYLKKHGETRSRDIYASLPAENQRAGKRQLSTLKKNGEVVARDRFYCSLATNTARTRPDKAFKEISKTLRTAEANKATANTLMDIYDDVLAKYREWISKKIDSDIDFDKELLFIENLKWLTAIGDKLMKRWSLEHVGYDTNTRQAQEDAKAKTAEREKAALEDAPLSDRVMIIGKYDPKAEVLLDCMPTSLEKMTNEEQEKTKV